MEQQTIQSQLNLKNYIPGNGFIGKYQKLIKETVIPYQYGVLCDQEPEASKSHVKQNFINAAKALKNEENSGFFGMVFQDSDAAKWLEAVAYSLIIFPDKELEKTADEFIHLIAEAQDKDGYLDTAFTIKDKEKRWTNLREGHEMYCSGHMMEAACAYYEATGKKELLDVMVKNMELIYKLYIEEKKEGYPGHPEIELALIKIYQLTKNKHALELAKHFITIRGVDPEYYKKEREKNPWDIWSSDVSNPSYNQANKAIKDQTAAVGHSVRCVYLYTGVAGLISEYKKNEKNFNPDDKKIIEQLQEACNRIWKNIIQKRMYLTGGIGSTNLGEAFTEDYDLPSDTAYAETCASIGLMFFASKMLESNIDNEYTDTMERAFYNTVLAGMQLDGKKFFYVNPLEIVPGISGVVPTQKHDLPERPKWYACACCPPNVARLITSFGKYAYGESENIAYCHLYAEGNVNFKNGIKLICETEYPYELNVKYTIKEGKGLLAIRIPKWSENKYKINGVKIEKVEKGYAYINVNKDDVINLELCDEVRIVYPSSKIPSLSSSVAFERGPLVYCFEGVDNGGDVLSLRYVDNCKIEVLKFDKNLLNGIIRLKINLKKEINDGDSLYSYNKPKIEEFDAIAVPYYTWGNRGINQMRVWINKI